MEEKIEALLKPITDELGVDVIKVSLGSGGHSQLLRVTVDKAGGLDSDVLTSISRALALQLDAEDPIKGVYRLEVSTPGLDWPLQTKADFDRHADEWVKVVFPDGSSQEGRNLGAVDDGSFTLLVDGGKRVGEQERVVALADVSKVIRAINWKEVSRGMK
ncbi:ribosome maturation factor RimP [Mariprofundus erugo]|uniref:Ribosome maturation factor RimP n=1 Tax=Mariprofundus erugo TaxID=2528639 RepID=A0A5R9GJK4_9PROT|nr:ribosome maturation factor RimP [Mariprofundus erugo]TLS78470.1 ribosome maturation factor RimP [Mariprofundus erugo]